MKNKILLNKLNKRKQSCALKSKTLFRDIYDLDFMLRLEESIFSRW